MFQTQLIVFQQKSRHQKEMMLFPFRDGDLKDWPRLGDLILGLGLSCPCLGLGGQGIVCTVLRTGLGLEAGLET